MLSSVGVAALRNPVVARVERSSANRSCGKCSPDRSPTSVGTNAISLSEPELPAASDGFYQRTSLTLRAHSRLTVSDDGQVRATSHARLRFSYDFEAADGTKIRIRAKVNLNYCQTSGGDEGTQSTKLHVNARVSVLQETVSTGVATLLEAPDVSEDAKSRISQAVDLFHQVTDAAASLFLDSDPLDGDSLIAGLVDAFNQLSESLDSISLSAAQAQESVSSDDVGELLEQASATPVDAAADAAAPVESVPSADVGSELVPSEGPQNSGELSEPESESVENVGQEEPSTVEDEAASQAGASESPREGQDNQSTTDEPAQPSLGLVMLSLRLRVIQSLSSITNVFDSDSGSVLVSQSTLSVSAQLAARYHLSGPGLNDSPASTSQVDTYAG